MHSHRRATTEGTMSTTDKLIRYARIVGISLLAVGVALLHAAKQARQFVGGEDETTIDDMAPEDPEGRDDQ